MNNEALGLGNFIPKHSCRSVALAKYAKGSQLWEEESGTSGIFTILLRHTDQL